MFITVLRVLCCIFLHVRQSSTIWPLQKYLYLCPCSFHTGGFTDYKLDMSVCNSETYFKGPPRLFISCNRVAHASEWYFYNPHKNIIYIVDKKTERVNVPPFFETAFLRFSFCVKANIYLLQFIIFLNFKILISVTYSFKTSAILSLHALCTSLSNSYSYIKTYYLPHLK